MEGPGAPDGSGRQQEALGSVPQNVLLQRMALSETPEKQRPNMIGHLCSNLRQKMIVILFCRKLHCHLLVQKIALRFSCIEAYIVILLHRDLHCDFSFTQDYNVIPFIFVEIAAELFNHVGPLYFVGFPDMQSFADGITM